MTEILDEDTIAMARRLRDLRAEKHKLERDEKDLRLGILERLLQLKTNEGVTASGAPVTHITTSMRRSVDSKKLEAKYPNIFEECSAEKPTVTVHIDIED